MFTKRPTPFFRAAQGAVLLEVILALGLMLFATAVINQGMQASVDSVERLRNSTHAQDLAVSVMSQIHIGILPKVSAEPQPFSPPFEDWTYEVVTKDFGQSVLNASRPIQVEVIVRHATLSYVRRLIEVFPPGSASENSSFKENPGEPEASALKESEE